MNTPATTARKVAIICSRGGLDEAYPALILANAARMSGIEAFIFFTFYGLDVITKSKVDHLHVNMAGNPTSPMPTVLAGLPGMSIPCGFVEGLPVGLQIVGPHFSEARMLNAAHRYQTETDWHLQLPAAYA